MKKLLLSSVVLSIFAISITIFQMSCGKQAIAQQTGSNYILPSATISTLGGIIVGNGLTVTSNGTLAVSGPNNLIGKILYTAINDVANPKTTEFWTVNYDGTNQTMIPITLPSGLEIQGTAKLSSDGQYIIFAVATIPYSSTNYIYKSKLDGSGLAKLADVKANFYAIIEGVY